MQLQVLFSHRDPDALVVDGTLYAGGVIAEPVTIFGARTENGMLGLIIPATLDTWAEQGAIVDVRDTGSSIELSDGETRVTLHPVDART